MMNRLTRWNERTEQAELKDWDEDCWKDFISSLDTVDWLGLYGAIDKLAEYEDLEEELGDFNKLKEQHTPIKPLKAYDDDVKQHWLSCPMCYKGLCWEYNKLPKYCPECGQAITK